MQSNDLIQYLTDEGYSVFPHPNFIPAEVAESKLPCLFVRNTGGFAPHGYVPTERPTWQIIVKGKSFKSAPSNMTATEVLAEQLKDHFHRKANYTIGRTHVFSSMAMQQPIYLGLDDQDRPMYSVNIMFYVREE